MIPQGSAIVNVAYFTSLKDQINGVGSCSELQALTDEAYASINASLAGINDQVALFAPMLALLTAPTSPTAVVTWVTSFITDFLTPYLKPAITYTAQITALTAEMALVADAISTKAGEFTSCSVPIPPLT